MKNKLIISATFFAMLAIAASAHAGTSYAAFMFNALNASGSAPIHDGTFRMLVDTNNDGLGTPAGNAWLWDQNDITLDFGQIINGECFPAATFLTARPAGVDPTDNVYLLWFDQPFSASSQGPGVGTRYGVENLGVMGADPGDYSFFPAGGGAAVSVVPEPGSLAILGVGTVFLAARRRRA